MLLSRPHSHNLPQELPVNSSLGTLLVQEHCLTLPHTLGLTNFTLCYKILLTKFLPKCMLHKIFYSPSVWILSSSDYGTLQRRTSLTVPSFTHHQTLTCTTATVFLISALVSGVISCNPFCTQQLIWSFQNIINQFMVVSYLKSSSGFLLHIK